ncbi:MAG: CARDB domain-containing protein [Candidatus Bathyarchaeia archaeon]
METAVYFNISLTNLTLDPKNITISVSVLDCTNVPMGLDQLHPILPQNETNHYIMSVFIPKWARLGIATAYASVFVEGKLVDMGSMQFRIDPPDLLPPIVSLLSPRNVTYGSSSVPLVFTVDERLFWAGYSLNNQENVTIEGNLTLSLVNGLYSLVVYASDASGNVGFSQVHFAVLVVHDVAVIDLYCTPLEVFVGQLVSMSVSVQNEGTVAETFAVSIIVDSITIDTLTVTNLFAGNNTALCLTWNTTGMTKGNYTIRSSAHPVLGEIDMADNTSVDRIVSIMARPDIELTNVAVLRTVVGQGYPVQVSMTIMNQGDRTETCNVSVYANSELIQTKAVTLTGGTSTVTTYSWITTDFAKGNYTIAAFAWPVPNEVDTADNIFSGGSVLVTIPGDVDGDRSVSVFDIVLISNLYRASQTGDPRYDPNRDIEGDGDVDIFDIVLAAGHYGEDW